MDDSTSFENSHLMQYDHGFEKIYALEDVDIASIRPFHQSDQEAEYIEIENNKDEEPNWHQEDAWSTSYTPSQSFHLQDILKLMLSGLEEHQRQYLLFKYELSEERYVLKNGIETDFNPVLHLNGIKRKEIEEKWYWLIDVVIIPWLTQNEGIAKEWQLKERLEITSRNPDYARKVLKLIEDYHLVGKHIFLPSLIEIESGLYALDKSILQAFHLVKEQALSYFYKQGLTYPLNELKSFLIKEFSLKWECFSDSFIEQVLKVSKEFELYSSKDGTILVSLS